MKDIISKRLKNIYPKCNFKKKLELTKTNLLFLNQDSLQSGKYKEMILPNTVKTELTKLGVSRMNFLTEKNENEKLVKEGKSLIISSVPEESKSISEEDTNYFLKSRCSTAISSALASKQKNFNIFFDNFNLPIRKKIINNIILSSYNFSLNNPSKKETELKSKDNKDNKDQIQNNENDKVLEDEKINKKARKSVKSKIEKNEDVKDEVKEEKLTLNFELDSLNIQHIDEIKYQINLSLATLETRELCNLRADIATTDYLTNYANSIRDTFKNVNNINIKVIEGENLKNQGYELIYNVGKASQNKPKIVSMEYYGTGKQIDYVILGKGLTFDTGGLNLKPGNSMDTMFYDKHGACNVISLFHLINKLQLNINVAFVMGLAENSVDSVSYRPSDILVSKKGLTVEVGNTDAEGRLVLADCLTFAQKEYSPKLVIDLATLTGACKVALGNNIGGLFTNNDLLAKELLESSR